MAQSHALHSRFSFDGLHLAQQELFASHRRYNTTQAPEGFHNLDTYSGKPSMAQAQAMLVSDCSLAGCTALTPLKQYQYKYETDVQEQSWPIQQPQMREYKAPVAQMATPPSSSSSSSSSSMSTAYPSVYNNAIPWSLVPTDPLMLLAENAHFSRNGDLMYSQFAAHDMVVKDSYVYPEASYLTPGTNGTPQGLYRTGSKQNMSVSLSPGSYFSTPREPEPLSPCSLPEQALQGLDWSHYSTPCPTMRRSSPQSAPSGYSITSAPTSRGVFSGENRFLAQTHKVCNDMLMPSASAVYVEGEDYGLPSPDGSGYNGSGYTHPEHVTAHVSPQYLPSYSAQQPDLSLSVSNVPHPSSYLDQSSVASNTNNSQVVYSCGVVASMENQENQDQSSRVTDTEAQKRLNDRILIQGKTDGLTYKEIRRKLVGEKPAESTLRGRYRSLTKARKDRVRKPVWSAVDVSIPRTLTRDLTNCAQIGLLNESVRQEFDRIARLYADPKTLTRDQKLSKVQWKKVADYIEEEGGSYHFGNSTCKRKWLELHVRS